MFFKTTVKVELKIWNLKSESSIHSVKPYASWSIFISRTSNCGSSIHIPREAALNTFYSRFRNYRYGISENSSLRKSFSVLRNSFYDNMKTKNAGSTQRWLGICGSSIYFRQKRFLNTFSFSPLMIYMKQNQRREIRRRSCVSYIYIMGTFFQIE